MSLRNGMPGQVPLYLEFAGIHSIGTADHGQYASLASGITAIPENISTTAKTQRVDGIASIAAYFCCAAAEFVGFTST